MNMTKNEQRKALRYSTQQRFTTPQLELFFPVLGTPDKKGEFSGAYGKYKVPMILKPSIKEHADFIDALHTEYTTALKAVGKGNKNPFNIKEHKTKAKYLPGYTLQPGETEDSYVPTGDMVLNIQANGGYMDDDREDVFTPIRVFNASNVEMSKDEKDKIGTGSTAIAVVDTYAYYEAGNCGLSVKLVALKIVEQRSSRGSIDANDLFGPVSVEGISLDPSEGSF